MYRIAWKYKTSSGSGHGEYCFASAGDAQAIVDDANKRHSDIHHWVEEEAWPGVISDEGSQSSTCPQ